MSVVCVCRCKPGVGDAGAVLPVAAHHRPQHPPRLRHAHPAQTGLQQ